jgi:hypothetical protein
MLSIWGGMKIKGEGCIMEVEKVFIREDGTATIRCPTCRMEKVVSAERFRGKHNIKIKCKCKSVFGIQFEFRGKYRKETDLDGFFRKLLDEGRWGKIIWQSTTTESRSVNCKVKNVSVLGIGLTTFGNHRIKEGDHIKIEFTLDTPSASKIEKKAVVRGVKGNYIGCEFFETDKNDRDLAFYVL